MRPPPPDVDCQLCGAIVPRERWAAHVLAHQEGRIQKLPVAEAIARNALERATLPPDRETLRSRRSVRTLFEVRGRVTLVWALICLAMGSGAYIIVRALLG